jgi:hypothetical protein
MLYNGLVYCQTAIAYCTPWGDSLAGSIIPKTYAFWKDQYGIEVFQGGWFWVVAKYNLHKVLLVAFVVFRGWGGLGKNLVTLESTVAYIYLHHLHNNYGVNLVTQQHGYLSLRSVFDCKEVWWWRQLIRGITAPVVRRSSSADGRLPGVASLNTFITIIVFTDIRTILWHIRSKQELRSQRNSRC